MRISPRPHLDVVQRWLGAGVAALTILALAAQYPAQAAAGGCKRAGKHCNWDSQCCSGLICGSGETCQPGCRIGGTAYPPGASPSGNACETCLPSSSTADWSDVADGTLCDDASACTTDDTCRAGTCVGGLPPACDDEDICTADSCDAELGCVNTHVGVGNACATWVTDGYVEAVELSGDTLYIGGSFRWLSPEATAAFVGLDPRSAQRVATVPEVLGSLYDVASDGAGGWYLLGDFSKVGDVPRHRLARVLADGTVTDWDPCGHVDFCLPGVAIAVGDGVVYVGGTFFLGKEIWPFVAAFDARTGQLTSWNPQFEPTHWVETLLVSGDTLYVGGATGGPANLQRLWAIDTETAAAHTVKTTDGTSVQAFAVHGDTLFVAGDFTTIDGQARNGVAAIDTTTWLVTPWNPSLATPAHVRALAIHGDTLFVGGQFSSIAGASRTGLAALDANSGAVLPWDPGVDLHVTSLALSGNTLYAGGSPQAITALDVVTGAVTPWSPQLRGGATVVATSGNTIGLGGSYFLVGGFARDYLAAIDVRTGAPTAWNPNGDCFPTSPRRPMQIRATNERVYLADFISGGGPGAFVDAIDPDTSSATCVHWSTLLQYTDPRSLSIGDQSVYVGGGGSWPVIALQSSDGTRTDWDPRLQRINSVGNLNLGWPNVIEATGDTVYLAGAFDFSHGQPRSHIAAVDGVAGLPTAFDPNPIPVYNDGIRNIEAAGGLIYVAGLFSTIGGQSRPGLAALDPSTGLATSWSPALAECYPADIELDEGTVYSIDQTRLCATDATTGASALLSAFEIPELNGTFPYFSNPGPDAFEVGNGIAFIGGWYGKVGGAIRNGIAAIAVGPVNAVSGRAPGARTTTPPPDDDPPLSRRRNEPTAQRESGSMRGE